MLCWKIILGMVCDYPAAYEGEPGFEFICGVPTVWDETEVIDAKVNEYILMARRKNKDWWIGAINNHQPRTLQVPLEWLGDGGFEATIFTDAPDTDNQPNRLTKGVRMVTRKDSLEIQICSRGRRSPAF